MKVAGDNARAGRAAAIAVRSRCHPRAGGGLLQRSGPYRDSPGCQPAPFKAPFMTAAGRPRPPRGGAGRRATAWRAAPAPAPAAMRRARRPAPAPVCPSVVRPTPPHEFNSLQNQRAVRGSARIHLGRTGGSKAKSSSLTRERGSRDQPGGSRAGGGSGIKPNPGAAGARPVNAPAPGGAGGNAGAGPWARGACEMRWKQTWPEGRFNRRRGAQPVKGGLRGARPPVRGSGRGGPATWVPLAAVRRGVAFSQGIGGGAPDRARREGRAGRRGRGSEAGGTAGAGPAAQS
jgi:hypothetical protein